MFRFPKSFSRRTLALLTVFLTLAVGSARAADQTVYDDALQNGWQNYGWATLNYNNSSPTHSGSASISVTAAAYQALYLHHGGQDGSQFTNLTFWINGGSSGGQRLQVQATRSGHEQNAVAIGPLAANVWQQISIPLSSLGVASASDFDGFWIQETSGQSNPTFYVDDISLGAAAVPAAVNLTVNAASVVRTIDSRLYGLNTAMYDSWLGNPVSRTLLAGIENQALRFPGGSLSDQYDWSVNRTYDTNSNTLSNFTWASGMNVYAPLAEAQRSQTYLTINYGSGTPEMAAAWVAYANGSASNTQIIGTDAKGRNWGTVGQWAALRGQSPLVSDDGYNFLRAGHPAAYNYRYWEIGNECFGGWEYDQHGTSGTGLSGAAHDGVTYGQYFKAFSDKMKAVDPSVKLGAVVEPGEDSYTGSHSVPNHNQNNAMHSGWTPVTLATLKSQAVTPDFAIYHRYAQFGNDGSDATLLQLNGGWGAAVANLRQMLGDYLGSAASAGIEIVVTETNGGYQTSSKQGVSLVNGLFHADTLGSVAQTEVNGCLWWDFRNGPYTGVPNDSSLYGWRIWGDDGMVCNSDQAGTPANTPYPAYYAAKLFTHWGRGGDQVVSAASDYGKLTVYASKLASGALSLIVINKDPTNDLTGHIALSGFSPAASATTYKYGKPEDLASADLTQSALSVPGATFDYVFPSYSMTALVLPAQANAAADVSTRVQVKRGGFRFNRGDNTFVQQVTLTNRSGANVAGPVALVLDGLNATLVNRTGTTSAITPAGSTYIDATSGAMANGSSVTLTLQFTYSGSTPIAYTTRVFDGTGAR